MVQFAVQFDVANSPSLVQLTSAQQQQLLDSIVAAGAWWSRYLAPIGQTIVVDIVVDESLFSPGEIAFAGPTDAQPTGALDEGVPIWEGAAGTKLRTGVDINGSASEITIGVSAVVVQSLLWFRPDPFAPGVTVPSGKIDALSVFMHELAHGLGFVSLSESLDDPTFDHQRSTYDARITGEGAFVGPLAGTVPLGVNDLSHLPEEHVGYGQDMMSPAIELAQITPVSFVDVAILGDIGLPLRSATAGDDALYGFDFVAFYPGLTGDDTISSGGGNDILYGLSGNDNLFGEAGADQLYGGLGNDHLDGGADDDVFYGEPGSDSMIGGSGFDTVSYAASVGSVTVYLNGTPGAPSGDAQGDTISQVEKIIGSAFNDTIVGSSLADTIDGGAGDDTMAGGDGDDTFYVNSALDVATEQANQGTDIVVSSVAFVLGANVENLTLTSAAGAAPGTGNASANFLVGNAFDNTLDGGSGADTMIGGMGNDSYITDNSGDAVTENSGEGYDTVSSQVSWTLGTNLERLNLIGAASVNGTGNSLDNIINGNSGANTLDGAGGNDTLTGGAGADTMLGGAGTDTVTYAGASSGVSVSMDGMTAGSGGDGAGDIIATDVEVLIGSAFADSLTGNALANTIDGGAGSDTMAGSAGDDLYYVTSGDTVVELSGQGTDLIQLLSGTGDYTMSSNVENLTFSATYTGSVAGNALANLITGNALNNTIDGGGGIDTLIGGLGDDVYVVDDLGDTIVENPDEGSDGIKSHVTWTLAEGGNVEGLTLVGNAPINGTGNSGGNGLVGNSAANVLRGEGGNDYLTGESGGDTLIGGTGDDHYLIYDSSATIVENAGEGIDRVDTVVDYTLAPNIEELTLSATNSGPGATHGVGNDQNNVISGGGAVCVLEGRGGDDRLNGMGTLLGGDGNDSLFAGNWDNTLDGGPGADDMHGGRGPDIFFVDSVGDVVTDVDYFQISWNDTVKSSIDYTLGAEIENLVLLGSVINGTGNPLANKLTGNGTANTLRGMAGSDTIEGGPGADLMDGGADSDTASYAASAVGVNIDLGAASFHGGDAEGDAYVSIENITGSSLADTIVGDSGSNTIAGGPGNDTVNGASGFDVASYAGSAAVTVDLGISGAQNTQGAGIDTLISVEGLLGSDASDALTGDGGDNLLDGGPGVDTLVGGLGNDTYVVDFSGFEGPPFDSVMELPNEGIDTIKIFGSTYALPANVENLLSYSPGMRIGNSLDNTMTAAQFGATFYGGAGNDTLVALDLYSAVSFYGESGNDIFDGIEAAGSFDGGGGIDRSIYTKPRSAYTLSRNGSDWIVTGGPGSGDTLKNIERAVFADQTVSLRLAPVFDFSGEGNGDILFQNDATAQVAVWTQSGLTSTSADAIAASAAGGWVVKAASDIDGDANADILLQNSGTGAIAAWLMNGLTVLGADAVHAISGTAWSMIGTGDFNSDLKYDILLQNNTTSQIAVWLMNGLMLSGGDAIAASASGGWQIKGIGDFNGDGKSDVLLQNSNTNQVSIWLMNGLVVQSADLVAGGDAGTQWRVKGTGDFNGDGKSDVLLQNASTNEVAVWFMNGLAVNGGDAIHTAVASGALVKGAEDLNGDGSSDILFQNTNGTVSAWLMNGLAVSSLGNIGSNPGSAWQVIAPTG